MHNGHIPETSTPWPGSTRPEFGRTQYNYVKGCVIELLKTTPYPRITRIYMRLTFGAVVLTLKAIGSSFWFVMASVLFIVRVRGPLARGTKVGQSLSWHIRCDGQCLLLKPSWLDGLMKAAIEDYDEMEGDCCTQRCMYRLSPEPFIQISTVNFADRMGEVD